MTTPLVLDTTWLLRARLSAAGAVDVRGSYAETGETLFRPFSAVLTSTTDSTLLDEPPANSSRTVRSFSFVNRHATAIGLVVELFDGTNARRVIDITLGAGCILTEQGVFDRFGRLLHSTNAVLAGLVQAQSGATPAFDWSAGLTVNWSLPASNVTVLPAWFSNPVTGETHNIVLLNNATGGNRTITMPNTGAHRIATAAITVNNNQARIVAGLFDGTVYRWAVGAAMSV